MEPVPRGDRMSRIEKRIAAVLWVMFLLVLLLICVLSFQSGSATKAFEKPFVEGVTGRAGRQLSRETILTITFYIRQAGKGLLFAVLGFCGGTGALLCFRTLSRPVQGAGALAVLFGISYFTEKMKIFIEGRHYAFAECLEGFVFAAAGYLCAAAALSFWRKRRKKGGAQSGQMTEAET